MVSTNLLAKVTQEGGAVSPELVSIRLECLSSYGL